MRPNWKDNILSAIKFLGVALVVVQTLSAPSYSQQSAVRDPIASPGDQPESPGPLATDISAAIRPRAIRAAMRRVADWQLQQIKNQPPNREWFYGTLDIGLMAASRTLHERMYSDRVVAVGKYFEWKLTPLRPHAPGNDYAIAQAFLDIYRTSHRKEEIAPLQKRFDESINVPDNPDKPVWWWCDALFMEPAAGMQLSQLTGDPQYARYVEHEWAITEHLLYDSQVHLFSRDVTYIAKHERNGEKIFWSRGNGWVMAGIVRVLASMPQNDPLRAHYIGLLRQMSEEVASIQGRDGLWRPGMLDAASYPLPEISGSAFFVYAMAWGINHHLLDERIYRPVVEKAWRGMAKHIYQNGRLGCIQPIGGGPETYKEDSSYVFGVGAFLLAGSEMEVMSRHRSR